MIFMRDVLARYTPLLVGTDFENARNNFDAVIGQAIGEMRRFYWLR
jgi:hypothetical protein